MIRFLFQIEGHDHGANGSICLNLVFCQIIGVNPFLFTIDNDFPVRFSFAQSPEPFPVQPLIFFTVGRVQQIVAGSTILPNFAALLVHFRPVEVPVGFCIKDVLDEFFVRRRRSRV